MLALMLSISEAMLWTELEITSCRPMAEAGSVRSMPATASATGRR